MARINNSIPNYTLNSRADLGSLEVKFGSKPAKHYTTALKSIGYRWGKTNQCWYRRGGTPAEVATALKNAKPATTVNIKPTDKVVIVDDVEQYNSNALVAMLAKQQEQINALMAIIDAKNIKKSKK